MNINYMLCTGEILISINGRKLNAVPKIDTSSNRKIINSIKRIDKWLYDEAIKETKNNDWQQLLIKAMNFNKLSPADRDHLNLVLFDDILGPTDKNRYT